MCQQDTSSTQVPVFPNNIVLKIDWQKLCSIDWFVQFCFGHNNIVRFHIIADAGNLCGFTFNAVGIDCLDIKLAIRIWEWLVFTTTYCGTLGLTSWSTGESCWPRELKAPGLKSLVSDSTADLFGKNTETSPYPAKHWRNCSSVCDTHGR